jgi:hypothetical protein
VVDIEEDAAFGDVKLSLGVPAMSDLKTHHLSIRSLSYGENTSASARAAG